MQRYTWSLHKLTPLHNIDFREVQLKKYAARIKQALARNTNVNENNIVFSARVSQVETTDDDNNTLKTLQVTIVLLNWCKFTLHFVVILS